MPDEPALPHEWTSPLAAPPRRPVAGAGRRAAACAAAAAAVVLCALALASPPPGGTRGSRAWGVAPKRRIVLTDGVNEAEWGVKQAFATFAHVDDGEHPAVQQAVEFSLNETARRKARVCEFLGDMGDLLGEMSTERAIEMVRQLDEVQGDAAWESMKSKFLAGKQDDDSGDEEGKEGEGGEGGGGEDGEGARRRLLGAQKHRKRLHRSQRRLQKPVALHRVQALQEEGGGEEAAGGEEAGDADNATSTEDETKPLTPREQLLAKFGCDLTLKRLPGFWGEWFFIGQMPAPHNQMTENGPTTDVAMLTPNVTKVSETIDFGNQEELNEVSHKIPPEAFAVKWTGDVLIKQLGTYTFYTTSFDGSRVFVDNQLIVDNSGYHASQTRSGAVKLWEGYHSVVIDYFVGPNMASYGRGKMIAQYSGPDTGGEVLVLKGTHDAALEKDAVPEDVEVEYVPGWWGGYYFVGDYMAPVITMSANGPVVDVATLQPNVTSISEDVNFNSADSWRWVSDRIPLQGKFAAKWIGNVEVKVAGRYTFSTQSDDGSRLWINNQMIIDNGGYHQSQKRTGSLHLWPGFHSIVADFFHAGGTATMTVRYSGPDTGNVEALVKAVHEADLDNSTALQPVEMPEEPEWKLGFWGQYFYPPLAFGSKGPSVDVSTLTPSFEAASDEINYRAYISDDDHSSLAVTLVGSNPVTMWCGSSGANVNSCAECTGGDCMSPSAALENRDPESSAMWNPQGAPENYNDYYMSLDVDFPTQVKAVLWGNNGDTVHDPTQLLVFLSDDAVSWTHVATLDLSSLRGGKVATVLAMPATRAARYWKLNPRGTQYQPTPRVVGLCDTADCAAIGVPTGSWAVGETPSENFPVNGFAAKWMGSVEVQTAGTYTFYLSSRDGARLYINNKQVVDSYSSNGGWRNGSPAIFLWAGHHTIVADMFKAPQTSATAAVLLEYKGPDTSQQVAIVKGVHDPALEGEEPASEEAAEAAMREAKLIARDEAVLAAARNKGAELAASLARLRAQENKLRQKETLHTSHAIAVKPPLEHGNRHGPLDARRVVERRHDTRAPYAPRVVQESAVPRGRGTAADSGRELQGDVRERVRQRMQWPSYRSDRDSYELQGDFKTERSRSSVLDTERRWGWVKRGLEGYGRREGGYVGESEGGQTEGARREMVQRDSAPQGWERSHGPRRRE